MSGYTPISPSTAQSSPFWSPQSDTFDSFDTAFDAFLCNDMMDNGPFLTADPMWRDEGQYSPYLTPFQGFNIPSPCPQARLSDIKRTVIAQDNEDPEPPKNIAACSYAHPRPVSFATHLTSEVHDIASPDGRRPGRREGSMPEKPPKGGWMYRCRDPGCAMLKPMKPSALKQASSIPPSAGTHWRETLLMRILWIGIPKALQPQASSNDVQGGKEDSRIGPVPCFGCNVVTEPSWILRTLPLPD
ncbi:hypothetical protein FRB97_006031 [Tulasnella sp. 331]|nr:hypothetical protein FRB97_006031 [Tulasnella sp. 331]